MRAYKFLALGAVGRFSEFSWPQPSGSEPGAWVAATAQLADCRHGVHACSPGQLLDWIDDELWEIELEGQIVASEAMLVAERGRLLKRIAEWDGATAQEFADACTWRSRDYALSSLRRVGLTAEAERLLAAVELVTEYLDGGLDPSERLAFERHVAICPPCRGYLSQLRRVSSVAGTLSEGDVPESLRESLLKAFRDWKTGPRNR